MPAHTRVPGAVLLGSDFKALGVARSLGRHGVPCAVIDNTPRSAWYSRYVTRRFTWSGPMDDPAFVAYLQDLAKTHGFERWLLVPMQDEVVELVARHTDALGPLYTLATQDWSVLRWACDKRLTGRMALEAGVPYPQTWYPASASDLDALDITYPVIIKPAISVHLQYVIRLKALPAANLEELRQQYDRAAAIISPDEIMVQEIIPGNGREQFSVAAYCKSGETLLRLSARRIRQFPIDYGLGSSFVQTVEVPEIFDLADRVTRFMGVTGMVEVEFKRDPRDGQYKLLDINLRPWGWHSLCRACGLDFPYIHYLDICGVAPQPATPRYGVRWARMLTDLPAGLAEMRAGLLSPLEYARSFGGRTTFSVFDWRDPLPAVGDLASAASRALHGSFAPHARKAHA
ncbi:MAG: ATP-grasp domain-containing protein [Ktedonobacterales bacterium]